MSTNLVHVLTLIGKSAAEVAVSCEELLGRRVERNRQSYGSDDWSEADHKAIADFCLSLIKAVTDLPVVYYSQYLDSWSLANSMFRLLEWPDGRRRELCGGSFGLAFYPSEFCRELLAQIKALRRRKIYRNQTEDRWYINQMQEALSSALWLEAPFMVLSISQYVGSSRQDDEIRAALNRSMGLTPVSSLERKDNTPPP
jgi:hypothetical protein